MRRSKIKVERFYEIPEDASAQQRWIINVLNEHQMTCAELARRIKVTRQAVVNWVNDNNRISFGNVCAIIQVLGFHDDPNKIYEIISQQEQRS